MKKEFSQMAFDFPMEAEPQAPPKNGLSAHHGELGNGTSGNGLTLSDNAPGLSAEEEHTVREEGRRAGVVVRIKSLKRPSEQAAAPLTNVETPVAPKVMSAPEQVFVQTSIPLEEVELPVVNAEIPAPVTEVVPEEPVAPVAAAPEPDPVFLAAVAEPAPVHQPATLDEPAELDPVPLAPPLPPRNRSASRPAPVEKAKKPAPVEKAKSKRGRKSLKEVAAEADLIDIPADDILYSKQYYTMGEVAGMFKVNQSLLRFWETEFSILQPRKNKKGDRYFRPIDIKNLHLIYHLLRQRKYTIEGAKEFLRKNKKAEQRFDAIQRLQQIKAFLLELKAQL
ncbi:MAG TPA: MerR family transcriptional regulator [Puia sp.]|nr:MerR family transcriptional regulator [Puia sp.]